MLIGMAIAALSTLASAGMTQLWQLHLLWGLLSGLAAVLAELQPEPAPAHG